jgi:hypothetical protein
LLSSDGSFSIIAASLMGTRRKMLAFGVRKLACAFAAIYTQRHKLLILWAEYQNPDLSFVISSITANTEHESRKRTRFCAQNE